MDSRDAAYPKVTAWRNDDTGAAPFHPLADTGERAAACSFLAAGRAGTIESA
jgi:hypothetical protein